MLTCAPPPSPPPAPNARGVVQRVSLQQMSKTRASKWSNTIEGQRRAEGAERARRLAEEEEKRKDIDAEEAALRRAQRRDLIERANKRLYDETDRTKKFHSRLFLSDVLKEREAQIAYKREVARREQAREERFVVAQRVALEEAEQKELAAIQVRMEKAFKQREIQDEQLNELRQTILAERAERMETGRQLLERDVKERALVREEDEARRARAKAANEATMKVNLELQRHKAEELRRDKEADAQIEAYVAKKEAMTAERRRYEEETTAEKNRLRDAMVEKHQALLLRLQAEREDQLANQADTKQKEQEAHDELMAEFRRQEMDAIDRSREQQLQIRAARRAVEKREEKEFIEQWKARTERLAKEDEAARLAQVDKAKALQSYHFKQIERKARRKQAAKAQALEEARVTRQILDEEERMFDDYTKACMDEWAAQGKDLTPMILEVTKKEKLTR